ncbi:MAG: hypothetical protein IKN31_02330 [Bacteroidales bacterium]|nr:hypothetical protein [Bacteroidales bacterium]
MKKRFYLLPALLLLAMSCNDVQDTIDNEVLEHVRIGVADVDLSDLSPMTKAEMIIGGGAISFSWDSDDVVGMFPDHGAQAFFEMSGFVGESVAEFDGGGWALKAASKYAVYYPYDYDSSNPHEIPFVYADQIQTGKDDFSHLEEYQHLATGSQVPENGTCNYQMERAEAIVLFKLTLPMIATYNELTVRVSDGTDIVVATMLDITGEDYVITPYLTSQMFTLQIADVVTDIEGETINFYAMMPPQDLSGKTIIISANTTDGDCCTAEVDGKNMLNNHAYQYVATLTSDMGSLLENFGSKDGNW